VIHTFLAYRSAGIVQTRITIPIPVEEITMDKMIAAAK